MILVVDDHIVLAHGLQRLLQLSGFEAAYVTSGQEALDFVQKQKPDLIILDQNMPGMSGLEVLRCLRNTPKWADVRVIFASAAEEVAIKEEAMALGALAYLQKGGGGWSDIVGTVRRHTAMPAGIVATGPLGGATAV